jgi:hypothetical protein
MKKQLIHLHAQKTDVHRKGEVGDPAVAGCITCRTFLKKLR